MMLGYDCCSMAACLYKYLLLFINLSNIFELIIDPDSFNYPRCNIVNDCHKDMTSTRRILLQTF